MAFFCRSALRGKGRTLQDALLRTSKPASHQGLASSPSESGGHFSARAFSSLLSKWQESGKPIGKSSHSPSLQSFPLHHPLSAHLFSAQQVRHVYVEVIDNDIDDAIKVYKRKLNNCKVEDKLKTKQYFVKPCERRKLAKHYKKLNRAKRELFDKLDTARHHMETVRETHRRNKQERKEAKAVAAAAETVAAAAAVAKSQTTG